MALTALGETYKSPSLLRVARVARGLTQAQLALRAELDRCTVSRLESGQRQPQLPTVNRLARALDWPPFALFDNEDRP